MKRIGIASTVLALAGATLFGCSRKNDYAALTAALRSNLENISGVEVQIAVWQRTGVEPNVSVKLSIPEPDLEDAARVTMETFEAIGRVSPSFNGTGWIYITIVSHSTFLANPSMLQLPIADFAKDPVEIEKVKKHYVG